MLTLEEKGLPYEGKLLEFFKGQHKSDEVIKWNPRGQLPTLVINDTYAINESFATCEYFEKLYGQQGTKLTPDDPVQLAKMLQRMHEIKNLDKKAEDVIHYKFYKHGVVDGQIDPEKAKKLVEVFFEEFARWEIHASEADYIAGSSLTLADLIVFPHIAILVRFGIDLQKHAPHLLNYYNRMVKRPSVEKTWPPHWKTSPSNTGVFEY